ncbi:MAG: glutathione S-transferase family protein [Alsobacter sp.]
MILRSSPASPFGRKVKIAASVLGLLDSIEVAPTDTMNPEDPIRQQNPLGKIPALILADGRTLYDSRVIVDYLDHLAPGVLFPATQDRFSLLVQQALADGLLDAALLQVYEGRFRAADRHEAKWTEHQAKKVERALAALEASPPVWSGAPHIGAIATACALGYLDLRFGGAWRQDHPKLVAWLDDFAAKVPAFEATKPH